MDQLERGNVEEVVFNGNSVSGILREPVSMEGPGGDVEAQNFHLDLPYNVPDLLEQTRSLSTPESPIQIRTKQQGFSWGTALFAWGPILLLVFLWFFFIRQMQGGSNKAFTFGKSRAKLVGGDKPRVTFDDVAGTDEAKVELGEVVEFLSDPKKFQRMGARIPRGVLLVGPPGTGKTLLAKAVAGEAKVPFFQMSGSDFVEMFVGVGASRVRDLFEQGKKNAPCIIFVDELDAVGRHRGAGLGGGHDEREQTLNQLLVEMDGFDTSDGVILLAATNRPDVLDPALLRPGRFDRQVVVDMPDLKGREGILKVHLRKIPLLADDVNIEVMARSTPGLSGADLANVVNEGALLAARRNHDMVYMEDLDDAKDKTMLGPERRSRVPSEEKRRTVAYHEAGHAIVGVALKDSDVLHKVTIVSRGMTGGVTYFLPKDDDQLYDREYLIEKIVVALGGRIAEELVFGKISNGAAGDIRTITNVARKMVTQWGMSDDLGPIAYGENEEMVFLGRSIQQHKNFSESTAQKIDHEVRAIVEECQLRCRKILEEHMRALHDLAEALLERETLTGEDVLTIIDGGELPAFDREALEASRKNVVKEAMTTADRIDEVLEEARKTGEPGSTGIDIPKRDKDEPEAEKEETQKRLFDGD
ncbi:ATP-dependent zinc metalloprotease FtsH [bacterium]|nr:ATP-dependent zinc metalloprotease FtsH [bacterium]